VVLNLHKTLTSITFGESFNRQVDNLPKTLTSLIFGYRFNQSVNNLPETLTSLTFDHCFNQKLNLQNFPVLKSLKLSKNHNQIIELKECPFDKNCS
jgi:hypothetical protein